MRNAEDTRLSLHKPRFCSECKAWTDHFADSHDPEPIATPEERRDSRWCSRCVAWTDHTSRTHDPTS